MDPMTDGGVEEKFCGVAEDALGAVRAVLDCVWDPEKFDDVAETPSSFAFQPA